MNSMYSHLFLDLATPCACVSHPVVDASLLSWPSWHLTEYVVHAVRAVHTECIGAEPGQRRIVVVSLTTRMVNDHYHLASERR